MSYILEALKKAQAERQLGSTPTIHAVPLHANVAGPGGPRRLPLWLAAGTGMLVAAAVAAVAWRAQAPVAPPIATVLAAAVPAQSVTPAPVVAAPAVAAPIAAGPAVAAPAAAAPSAPTAAAPSQPAPAPQKAPAPVPARPEPVAAPVAAEEILPMQRELPEAIARELPQVAIGGYIYSSNPADRLLLIDKILRREGDEVAPGLRLEKLLPKGAVMNYKGFRYRVPY